MAMNVTPGEAQTYQSKRPLKVGLMMPSWTSDTPGNAPGWETMLDFAGLAESVGFDSLWVVDEPSTQIGSEVSEAWECWSLLAALAAKTSRITLGTLVTCTSFRNPALLARFAVTVDEISGGRFILGLGVGGVKSTFDFCGFPWENRFGRFEEALPIIHRLLRTGYADFQGKYFQVRDCELTLCSPQQHAVPILIGTFVPPGPRMLRSAALYADMWNGGLVTEKFTLDAIEKAQQSIDEACRSVHRLPETLTRTASLDVVWPGYRYMYGPFDNTSKALTGSPEEMAEAFRRLAWLGISHIQIGLTPSTPDGVEKFASVLEILNKG